MEKEDREIGPYAVLLGALVFFLMLIPFVSGGMLGFIMLRLGLMCVFVAGLIVATAERPLRRVALPLLVVVIISEATDYFVEGRSSPVRLGISAFFLFFTAFAQLHGLLRQKRVTADTILGGINVYLLIACAYMLLYELLEKLAPGSFLIGDLTLAQYYLQAADRTDGISTLIYFSFVTITTLGYGDIVPVSSTAKLIASSEALFGQIYLVTFIARLVSLHGAAKGESSRASTDKQEGSHTETSRE